MLRLPWFFRNRWWRLVIYVWAIFVGSGIILGWQPLQLMMFEAGAYKWLCEDVLAENLVCGTQVRAINHLFTMANCAEFVFAVLAGLLFDNTGPRLTGTLGMVMIGLGLGLLATSNEHFQMYIPAAVLLGGGVNVALFPALILQYLFPKWSRTMVALMIGAQFLCTLIMPILWEIIAASDYVIRPRNILLWYLAVVWLPSVSAYCLSLPHSKYDVLETDDMDNDAKSTSHDMDDTNKEKAEESDEQSSNDESSVGEPMDGADASYSSEGSEELKEGQEETMANTSFLDVAFSLEIIFFTVYYLILIIQLLYYPTTLLQWGGADVVRAFAWMMPTVALWCILFGTIADYSGTLPICILLPILTGLSYVIGSFQQFGAQIVASCCHMIASSFAYSTKFTYVGEVFDSTHYGKLVGTISLMSGAFGLTNLALNDSTIPTGTLYIVMALLSIPATLIAIGLLIRQKSYYVAADDEEEEWEYEDEVSIYETDHSTSELRDVEAH